MAPLRSRAPRPAAVRCPRAFARVPQMAARHDLGDRQRRPTIPSARPRTCAARVFDRADDSAYGGATSTSVLILRFGARGESGSGGLPSAGADVADRRRRRPDAPADRAGGGRQRAVGDDHAGGTGSRGDLAAWRSDPAARAAVPRALPGIDRGARRLKADPADDAPTRRLRCLVQRAPVRSRFSRVIDASDGLPNRESAAERWPRSRCSMLGCSRMYYFPAHRFSPEGVAMAATTAVRRTH